MQDKAVGHTFTSLIGERRISDHAAIEQIAAQRLPVPMQYVVDRAVGIDDPADKGA